MMGQYILTAVKRAATAVVLAAACAAGAAAQNGGFDAIAPLVDAAIARRELPGAVVVVGRGDSIVYHRSFGRRALEPAPEAMTEDTIFDLASLTKVVAT